MSPEGRLFFPKDIQGLYLKTKGILELTVLNNTVNLRSNPLSPNDVRA